MGSGFPPSYLKIAEFISRLPYRPVIGAFTATATEQVKQDIIALLQLNQPFTLTTGFDRPNLYFGVARPRDQNVILKNISSITGIAAALSIALPANR